MSARDGRRAVSDLDAELALLIGALAFALVAAWIARGHVGDVRRELRAARTARETAQEEMARLRTQFDGALDELHQVAGERDKLRDSEPAPEPAE